MIWRLIRLLVILGLLAVVALLGYSYSGLLEPDRQPVTVPVDLGNG